MNFTLAVDAEEYRERTGQEIDRVVIRDDITEQAIAHIIQAFGELGLKVQLVRNQRQHA